MLNHKNVHHLIFLSLTAFALLVGLGSTSPILAADKPSLKLISPTDGATITTTDIPVTVEVSNFKISAADVGMPDKPGEGHIHVMLDGMNMGVLFNFYTTPTFTLLGRGIKPGKHKLIFDLASNTHMDMEDTAVDVNIDYEPTNPQPEPAPVANAGTPSVKILSPADGVTVGPQVTFQVQPTNFTPALDLEGKPNLPGYGHYHVFVDMSMAAMSSSSGMMSMEGMVLMPGSNTFTVDLSAWPVGKHTITIETVQNDHTPVSNAPEAMITINLQSGAAPATAPVTGGNLTAVPLWVLALGGVLLLGGMALFLRNEKRA